jgi:hypothetical protein
MGLLLAKSGRWGSSHKGWFSFWGPRHTLKLLLALLGGAALSRMDR